MRLPIPQEMRDFLSKDPFMRLCVVGSECSGRVEWHHAFMYAGKRINEVWAILPLCKHHHEHINKKVQDICRAMMRMRIALFGLRTLFDIRYPKSDLFK